MTVSEHAYEQRVRSYEIDAYRHVNNAAYVNWLEDARERFLRAAGRDYAWYPEHARAWIVVVNLNVDYLAAAHADDVLVLSTRLVKLGRSSVVFRHAIRDGSSGKLYCRARVVMAFGDGKSSAVPIPDDFRARFSVHPDGDVWLDHEGGEKARG